MAHLKIFRPDSATAEEPELPEILPFDRRRALFGPRAGRPSRAVDRARVLHENQICPFCSRATVEAIELGDGVISRQNHKPIPGTATLVGFHCHSCESEWPIYQVAGA